MGETIETDVLVCGAGPTGLALACQLTRYGINFTMVEKNPGVTAYSKALGVQARTLEIYEQLDLATEAVARGTVAGKVRLVESGEVLGEVDMSNVGQGLSSYPFMLVLEQSRNEQLMYDWLQRHEREVHWQTELESFSQTATGVTAQVRTSDGQSQIISSKYLVGCDGPRSPVRHGLGLAFEGSTFARLFYVADVQIDWQFNHDALNVCLAPHGVVAFFPLPGEKRWRIVGAFPDGHDADEGETVFEEIEARIKEDAKLELDITRVDWFSTYKVHTRHVEKFSAGRCFLAGDSAHIHTPAGGQGMNTGIQDAYNLGWKLALVLKNSANLKLLDTYNEERLPNARRLVATTDRMFNLAAGNDWLTGLIRTTVFPPMAKYILSLEPIRKKFFILISQIGISYGDSSLSLHREEEDGGFAVKAGARLPYFLVDGKSIYDQLRAPKFHLLTFADGQGALAGEPADSGAAVPAQAAQVNWETGDSGTNRVASQGEPAESEENYSHLVDRHLIPLYPHLAEIFGTRQSFNLLLRPDNYIAFISPDTSLRPVTAYLRDLFK